MTSTDQFCDQFLLKETHLYTGCLQDKLIWVLTTGRYLAHVSAEPWTWSNLQRGRIRFHRYVAREEQPVIWLYNWNTQGNLLNIKIMCFHYCVFRWFVSPFKSGRIFLKRAFTFCGLFWNVLQEVQVIVWLACCWDGGNLFFQLNQSAISSEQQFTAWGGKRGVPVGYILFLPSVPLFSFLLSFSLCAVWLLIWYQLSSILTLYPCCSYTPHSSVSFPYFNLQWHALPCNYVTGDPPARMWHNEDIRCMYVCFLTLLSLWGPNVLIRTEVSS